MRDVLHVFVIAVATLMALAAIFHLAVTLVQDGSPWNALISLGISAGAFGLWGLLDTITEIEHLRRS